MNKLLSGWYLGSLIFAGLISIQKTELKMFIVIIISAVFWNIPTVENYLIKRKKDKNEPLTGQEEK